MVEGFVKTPRYVLHEGVRPASATLVPATSRVNAVAIYGFSNKTAYDIFLSNCSLTLTPYPLVKLFLKNQIDQEPDLLKLVAIDACFPSDQFLCAATFPLVLESMSLGLESVVVSHRLVLDGVSSGYRIVKSPLILRAEELP